MDSVRKYYDISCGFYSRDSSRNFSSGNCWKKFPPGVWIENLSQTPLKTLHECLHENFKKLFHGFSQKFPQGFIPNSPRNLSINFYTNFLRESSIEFLQNFFQGCLQMLLQGFLHKCSWTPQKILSMNFSEIPPVIQKFFQGFFQDYLPQIPQDFYLWIHWEIPGISSFRFIQKLFQKLLYIFLFSSSCFGDSFRCSHRDSDILGGFPQCNFSWNSLGLPPSNPLGNCPWIQKFLHKYFPVISTGIH